MKNLLYLLKVTLKTIQHQFNKPKNVMIGMSGKQQLNVSMNLYLKIILGRYVICLKTVKLFQTNGFLNLSIKLMGKLTNIKLGKLLKGAHRKKVSITMKRMHQWLSYQLCAFCWQ